jgi:WD40 repeat protein
VIAASIDATISQWNTHDSSLIHHYKSHKDTVRSLTTLGDENKVLISGSWDKTINVWDLEQKTLQHTLPTDDTTHESNSFISLCHVGENTVASLDFHGQVRLIELGSAPTFSQSWSLDVNEPSYMQSICHSSSLLFTTLNSSVISAWDIRENKKAFQLYGQGVVLQMKADGDQLYNVSKDGTLSMHDIRAAHSEWTVKTGHGVAYCLDVCDGDVVTGGGDNTIREWNGSVSSVDYENVQEGGKGVTSVVAVL